MRSVDDIEIGVGPVTRELQKAYLATVNGLERPVGHWLDYVAERARERVTGCSPRRSRSRRRGSTSGRRSSCSRCCARGGSRSARSIDRFEELFAEAVGAPYAAAVSSGTAGCTCCMRARRRRPGRRGDHVAVLVRRVGELRDLRGRDARSSPTSTRARSTSTRPRSRRRSRRAPGPSSRSTSSATRASSKNCKRSATGTGSR